MRRLISAILAVAMAATTVLAQPRTHEQFNELRQRIDSVEESHAEHRERLHAAVNTAESEAAIIEQATEKILALIAGGSAVDAARRAEVEAEVRAELARIGGSHRTLGALRHEFEAEIDASKDLSTAQKTALSAIFREFEQKRITRKEAEESVNQLLGDSDSDGGDCIIIVLFILIVICVPNHSC